MGDLDQLTARLRSLPDRDLVAMLGPERDQYESEALALAEVEAESRRLVASAVREPAEVPTRRPERSEVTARVRRALLGRPPSAQYPALSYVAMALRLLAILFAALALAAGLTPLVIDGVEGWLVSLMGAFQASFAALLLFGGSELIGLGLDIEANTRGLRSETPPPRSPED